MNAVNLQDTYSKTLGELLVGFNLSSVWATVMISDLVLDSRKVKSGSLFFAVNGEKTQGEKFVRDAIEAGAVAIMIEGKEHSIIFKRLRKEFPEVPMFCDADLPRNISSIAGRFYNHPSLDVCCIGITGTNGKSSCVHLVSEIWRLLGRKSASIGTLGYGLHADNKKASGSASSNDDIDSTQSKLISTGMTTPDAISTQRILAEMRDQNVSHLAMEVSSHGIEQGRVSGVKFSVKGLTNVTRDHLDYHKTFDEYARVKSSFVSPAEKAVTVINLDDDIGFKTIETWTSKTNLVQYSLANSHADVYAPQRDFNNNGITARVVSPWGSGILRTYLLGDFNLSNLLACISICCSAGENFQKVLKSIAKLYPAPGRMQRVLLKSPSDTVTSSGSPQVNLSGESNTDTVVTLPDLPENVTTLNVSRVQGDVVKRVYIDFAHTPDALEKAIVALRQHTDKKLWVVFGCGGDRDVGKRYMMGEIAAQLCDYVIVTSDNPRSENPRDIIRQVSEGARAIVRFDNLNSKADSEISISRDNPDSKNTSAHSGSRLVEIEDRESAIAYAISSSLVGDTVLIAGKGHEDFQIIGSEKLPFSDYETASKYLEKSVAKDTVYSSGGEHASE